MSVVVERLEKRFGPHGEAAVAGVSFAAPKGRITSLLGPSGSGKTTLLRLIAGLEEPDGGTIAIDGTDCTGSPARLRGVGLVFQSYALFAHMNVRDNIAFGLTIRGASRREADARVEDLLALVQLPGIERRFPRELSGGQRQRVALARALATRPRLLLLDEPFGALDAQVRTELREWLLRFHEQTRVTTLLVTHDQEEALELSEHVVLLERGRVLQAGAPHELYDRPATPFVASFLGGSNVLRGKIRGRLADVGALLDAPEGARDGADVRAFLRPNDVRIAKAPNDAAGAVPASIDRLTRVGGLVKLALRLANGDVLRVQLTGAELELLGVGVGDRVHLDLKAAKVFPDERA